MENKNQTAVEYLYERLEAMIPRTVLYSIDKKKYFDQAKAMEKEQILQSHIDGQPLYSCQSEKSELYYKQTYK